MDINGIHSVSKLMIAAAWADNQLTPEEIESLKDLVYRFSNLFPSQVGISARQWAELEIYMDLPVTPEERERLLKEMQTTPLSDGDKAELLAALEAIIGSDGEISEAERDIVKEISSDLQHMHAGVLGQMGIMMGGAIRCRKGSLHGAPNREAYLDEFTENRIFYHLHQKRGFNRTMLSDSEYDLRKLGAAGGLMARVAKIDENASSAEFDLMVSA